VLHGYFDETGHSSDVRQSFNGMAGFLAQSSQWDRLEHKWKATLKLFQIPFFHMKDFAHSTGHFKGWNEAKRQRLLRKLLTHLESINPVPIGVIFSMDDFRSLPSEKRQYLTEPYLLSCSAMLSLTLGMLKRIGANKRTIIIFSDQVEFRQSPRDYYESACCRDRLMNQLIAPPDFRDMRDVVPLQAADLLAYELYKECRRRRAGVAKPARHGFERLTRMSNRIGWTQPGFKFVDRWDLLDFINMSQAIDRRLKYWRRRRETDMLQRID
jgi:Protein of unknown function (DUF3800)